MKKILAIALTAALLLSCVSAYAWTDATGSGNNNMTIGVSAPDAPFLIDPVNGPATKASQKTALWLQVQASGQINCTIPLALVYKTNIDGGSATTSDAYKIVNNSSSDLAVVGLKTIANDGDMTLVSTKGTDYDQYTASLKAGTPAYEVNLFTAETEQTKEASKGGLFTVGKAASGATTDCPIEVKVDTTKLTFVTGKDNAPNTSYGVHLLDIQYTVAISTVGAKGAEIKGTVNGTEYSTANPPAPSTKAYSYDSTGAVTSSSGN